MFLINKIFKDSEIVNNILNSIETNNTPLYLTGICDISKAHIILSIFEKFKKPILVLEKDDFSAKKMSDNINSFLDEEKALLYQTREFNFFDTNGFSREYERQRIKVLNRIVNGSGDIVVSSVGACLQRTMPKSDFIENTIKLKVGKDISIKSLLEKLLLSGYVKRNNIDGTHQFANRGDIVDIFTSDYDNPIRIEFFGDTIDSINFFDIDTQRRTKPIDSVHISPSVEVLALDYNNFSYKLEELKNSLDKDKNENFIKIINESIEQLSSGVFFENADKFLPICYEKSESILHYMDDFIVVISESSEVSSFTDSFIDFYNQNIVDYLEKNLIVQKTSNILLSKSELKEILSKHKLIEMDTFVRSNTFFKPKNLIDVCSISLTQITNKMDIITEEIQGHLYTNKSVILFCGNEKYSKNLTDYLRNQNIDAVFSHNINSIILGKVYVVSKGLSSGFLYKGEPIVVLTVSGKTQSTNKTVRKHQNHIKSLDDISVGDLVVHEAHGIGKYCGIFNMDTDGVKKDYIKIQYNSSDVLYLPIINMDLISRYISSNDETKVKLSKLHSAEWQKTKRKVYSQTKDIAKELISIYAKRKSEKGFSFSSDDDMQREFENYFEFIETDAQLRCIDEIKADMQKDVPMDRLLCGDVGFGKTEVALRAAFKCVNDSKQCAILAPTTILSWQHYITVVKRMENFPVNVELLSRFRTKKQQEEIVRKINNGEIDIIIGTHRLVQDDIKFKSLGLSIIDEEQRFGVKHKERFKQLFPSVDILTLSATPIPRTLNIAMSGIRDISIIDEAPIDRIPVQTYVIEHQDDIIIDAIIREKRRGGQTYYIYNNILYIDVIAEKIRQSIDGIRVEVAHGKMSESSVTKVWQRLINGEIDVLVCTTIIETGVDVQNCNTLIVENADTMGLSQLYQLRGRVGRSSKRAFCYLTFRKGKTLSEISKKRLSAIQEFTNFGSGFKIAMRDLEIRGAGDILGPVQHGHIASVGYDMYMKILNNAILEEKGEKIEEHFECHIDLPIDAYISENYIYDYALRIDIYKKIANIKTDEQSFDLIDELIDRFGNPPKSVKGLIDIAILKNLAETLFIYDISLKSKKLYFYCNKLDFDNSKIIYENLIQEFGYDKVFIRATEKPFISIGINNDDILYIVRVVLRAFEKSFLNK